MLNNKNLKQQIQATAQTLGLIDYVIEKDVYVTKAISIVTQVPHEDFELVFQGGTSLAKAHRLIKRMSEDCDFRIKIKASSTLKSKEEKRKSLRHFRHKLVDALRQNDFIVQDEELRVRNEGQFMSVRARYPSFFSEVTGIKPFLALEFFLSDVKLPTAIKPVTTLIQQTLGDKVEHPEFPVNTVSIMETAAEKWVALTRRIATMKYRRNYRDTSLVRHLYDLYQINKSGHFSNEFESLVAPIVQEDRQQYKNHNDAYYADPIKEIKSTITELEMNPAWKINWDQFMETMVFDEIKPSYADVLANLQAKTNLALNKLTAPLEPVDEDK